MGSTASLEVTKYPEYLFLTEAEKDRFWDLVDVPEGEMVEIWRDCWNWTGRVNEWGYGKFTLRNLNVYAHRIVGINLIGDAPQIRHLCNNKLCCNPFHLAKGDQLSNAKDRTEAGGYKNTGKRLAPEKRAEIISLRSEGFTFADIAERVGVSYNTVKANARELAAA